MKYFILHTEQIECSETSAYNNRTPGKYPKEYIQDSKHGGSLKSRIILPLIFVQTERNGVWFPEDGDSCYKTGWTDRYLYKLKLRINFHDYLFTI